jgi:hypothetical protein
MNLGISETAHPKPPSTGTNQTYFKSSAKVIPKFLLDRWMFVSSQYSEDEYEFWQKCKAHDNWYEHEELEQDNRKMEYEEPATSSVVTVVTDFFKKKNEINLLRKFAKNLRIYDMTDDSKI